MFKFLVAKLGYQEQVPGSLSTFQVACGFWATTKSYTVSPKRSQWATIIFFLQKIITSYHVHKCIHIVLADDSFKHHIQHEYKRWSPSFHKSRCKNLDTLEF